MELVQLELSGVSTRPVGPTLRGRVPVSGDRIRVACLSPVDSGRQVAEGEFLGTSGELLLLGGPSGASVSVPAVNVGSVQVREQRSRSNAVGVFGALAGVVAGGFWGRTWYQPDNFKDNVHYRKEVFITLGAVGGIIAGYLAGRATGSFIKTDVWVDAPNDWALRFTGLDPTGASASLPSACPGTEPTEPPGAIGLS